jgi:hypothetical protein
MTFFSPCARPPMNEHARKKAKLSQTAGSASAVPWTATAAMPDAATAPAVTRGDSSSAPNAMPTVQIDSISH